MRFHSNFSCSFHLFSPRTSKHGSVGRTEVVMAIEYKEAQANPIKDLREMLKLKPVQYFSGSLVVVVAEGKNNFLFFVVYRTPFFFYIYPKFTSSSY